MHVLPQGLGTGTPVTEVRALTANIPQRKGLCLGFYRRHRLMIMTTSELDTLIWTALTGQQAPHALGHGGARRFHPDIGPLAAIRDAHADSLAALAELALETGPVALMQPGEPVPVPGLQIVRAAAGIQMIYAGDDNGLPPPQEQTILRLGVDDFPDMLELAKLTQPGPFAGRTGTLGTFWGIRDQSGALVAMAGQRLCTVHHREVSAVCVHPDARGRGLAAALSRQVMTAILAEGRTPILHSYADNHAALSLYRRLGFVERAQVCLTVYVPEGWSQI